MARKKTKIDISTYIVERLNMAGIKSIVDHDNRIVVAKDLAISTRNIIINLFLVEMVSTHMSQTIFKITRNTHIKV